MNNQPTSYPPLIPGLALRDAARAIEFYKAAFGAVELFRLIDPESGKVGHAELTINGSLIMLADEYPAFNKAPQTLGGTSVRLCLMVDNVDASLAQAQSAGATVTRPATNEFYGHLVRLAPGSVWPRMDDPAGDREVVARRNAATLGQHDEEIVSAETAARFSGARA